MPSDTLKLSVGHPDSRKGIPRALGVGPIIIRRISSFLYSVFRNTEDVLVNYNKYELKPGIGILIPPLYF